MRQSSLTKRRLKALAGEARDLAPTQPTSARTEEALCIASAFEELIDRRNLMASHGSFRVMEKEHAYRGACDVVELYCGEHDESPDVFSDSEFALGHEEKCKSAILYLELRGIIDRDPELPGWFSLRNESEATA